jgi:thiol-disulfide isomerase/thioredoxin
MIIELTPETFFEHVKKEGPLHVVMHYGSTCNPCKITMPHYERVEEHFLEFKVTNVKFYRFHQWEESYKEFIENNNLKTNGVPTFKYFYMGDVINEETRSFNNPDELKRHITDTIKAIEKTMEMEFNLYAS